MDGSGTAYQYLIRRLEEVLPEVATQVRDEVARGRVVFGSKLSGSDRETRELRMARANAGKIAKGDIVSIEYSDDERLSLLVEALLCLVDTMQASRKAVVELDPNQSSMISFEEPDGSIQVEISLDQELRAIGEAEAQLENVLRPAVEELGRV